MDPNEGNRGGRREVDRRSDERSPSLAPRAEFLPNRASAGRGRGRRRREAMLWVWALVATVTLVWLVVLSPRIGRIPGEWRQKTSLPQLPEDRLLLVPSEYDDLPGWAEDPLDESAALALRRSCERWGERDQGLELGALGLAGRAGDWRGFCAAVKRLPRGDNGLALRRLLESQLRPYQVKNNQFERGLFTGYYEPLLNGRRRRDERYTVPLYTVPRGIVEADLGQFRDEWQGQRLAGRVRGGRFEPLPDRAAIDRGALRREGLELLWVDDPIDAFFLHIQGSGRVRLPDGREVRVGYAGQNGHPYFAIGRALIERGALAPASVSMQSIRAWLSDHPEQAAEVLALNRSFVFFRELSGAGPVGSLGVALVPQRSLAVDRRFVPLGVPVFLDTVAPDPDPGRPDRIFQRLLLAQDTGGAIRGPVRGDVFWGAGDEAAEVAGRMKSPGRMFLLLPRSLVVAGDRLVADP